MLSYSGKGRFVVEPIDLVELFEEMTHLLEVSMSKKVVLRYDFAENLPPFSGDATQIRQIIMNLITNASEAIGDNSGVIAVSTGAMECSRAYLDDVHETLSAGLDELLPEGRYIYLEVSDTGCGMDAETVGKIFDPFFTTKFAGRGLGMAAVLGIVRGHDGTIKIHSELGKGTTFKILFRASEFPENGAAIQTQASGKPRAWHRRGTILIVDDEETVRAVGKKMLNRMGFSVLTAVDGRDAIDLFRKRPDTIDCVLLDLTMPRLDGQEAFRKLRRIRPDVAVILCSGYNEQDATQRFAGKGLAGFIHKPFNMATLRETLMKVLPDDQAPLSGDNVGTRHEDLSPLVSKFLKTVASDHASARSALNEGNYKQVSSLGHRIHGGAGFYNFTDLSRLGAELDRAATSKDRATVESLLDAVRAELERLTASQ
jgi:CheY-like chemotaxis protein